MVISSRRRLRGEITALVVMRRSDQGRPKRRSLFEARQFDKKVELHKINLRAEVAQLVEHTAENRGVRSPILRLGTI